MSKPQMIYIHGFMSSGSTLKGQALKRRYGERFEVHLPTYTQVSPALSIKALKALMDPQKTGVLIGSSLGGFYAQYLACQIGWPAVLINPALSMACVAGSLLGRHTNPYTQEQVLVDESWLAQLSEFQVGAVSPSMLLLCADDETVRPDCALAAYRGVGQIFMLPQGGHACWPLAPVWPVLDAFLSEYVQ